jgi:two-component system nitrogen regulation response regulator NtrX
LIFVARLVAYEEMVSSTPVQPDLPGPHTLRPPSPGAKILVVEDDPGVLESLRLVLEQEGYSVETAANGQEALEAVFADPPAKILLDLWLPVMNGWKFLELLRALEPPAGDIPVIVISADIYARAEDLPVQMFMTKPMDVDTLLAAIRQNLQPT